MYSPKIQPEHIHRLYRVRESINRTAGRKVTKITWLVKEALDEYLSKREKDLAHTTGLLNIETESDNNID